MFTFSKLNLSDENMLAFINDISMIMTHQDLPNKAVLHSEGKVCDKLFFIHKGIARAYYHKDGKDITAHFALENETITAVDSFIQRKKSRYNIELLEEATLSYICYDDWMKLLEQKPQYEKFARIFLESIYIDIVERVEDIIFNTAKERYEKIVDKNPDLLQRVNLGFIASYIGISQETLSRIRAEVRF